MSDRPILVRIPPDLRDAIDAVRGDVPRERWVRRVLEQAVAPPVTATSSGHGINIVTTTPRYGDFPKPCPDCGSLGAHQRGCKRG